ncbi:heterokaryon incompatibility protein-domain-containing protein [Chaetomium strumarium]|uniref:Heterokaryon incompatibility protein-domain-containing protein n=1 Tax=Chaetomium strumarium TaxID=1170767 RepID=A0AAJ0M6U8_9PEZI|nr:heterokaryon incompatibility protein-domain-containing protein [Chaetomium strumarium]
MLSRHGLPQPIRDFAPTPAPNRVSVGARRVCKGCAQDVFNASLGGSLLASHAAASPSYTLSYSRLARDIYTSILDGCRWCTVVGSAVLTNSELEYWMRNWNGSRSDGASLFSTSSDGETESEAEDGDAGPGESEEATNAEEDATENPGFIMVESLACAAELDIAVEFLKWSDSQAFNLARVTVEAATSMVQGHCSLQEMVGDDAVVMTLEVICEDTLGDTPSFFPEWNVVSAADVNEWAPRAESWLRSCTDHHASCASTGGSFQPTRLIDVRDLSHPLLAISGGDAQHRAHPYAVLSYVWGPKQDYVLTKATVSQMCMGLDLSRTPKTISDAIRVAHRLGFDYLWVDALCIIQDSPEDKARELPLMANVYKESSLCIVAATAAAASEGFLETPTPPTRFMVEPFQIRLDSADGGPSSLTFAYRAPYMASADPISTRAWTLQERVLSRRLLLFGRNGVMWMCRECFINPGAAPDAGPPYQTSLGPDAGESESDDEGDHAAELERWMAIRADYSEMDLSYCTDKLPAISAVAAEVGRRTGWTYLAGMWAHNLFSELHWRCTKHGPSGEQLVLKPDKAKRAGYIAPSWSWASVGLGGIVDSEGERGDREPFDFTILECHVDASPDFPFGPVSGGHLDVRGKAVELTWRPEENGINPGWDVSLIDEQQQLSSVGTPYIVGAAALDPLDAHLDPARKLVCLGMSKLRLGRQRIQPIEGLLLLPSQSHSGVFHRIGFFRMNAPSVFDGAMTSIFRIE